MLLYLLILGFWLTFAVYGFWYFFIAKTFQPLTLDDLALTWRLHKQQTDVQRHEFTAYSQERTRLWDSNVSVVTSFGKNV